MTESLLLAVTRVTTLRARAPLTNATGFFFEREGRLHLVTNRHVVLDQATEHRPDVLQIELHVDPTNVAATTLLQVPLYGEDAAPTWSETADAVGPVDVVAVPLDRTALPPTAVTPAFTPAHLLEDLARVEVGTSVLIVGFPLGFHDTLHRLPVARSAVVASAFGFRFQGHGYFLTDALTHRGMSGAPVVTRLEPTADRTGPPWTLLGVHASRLDLSNRELQDDPLNLNCAWYADVMLALTATRSEPDAAGAGQDRAPAVVGAAVRASPPLAEPSPAHKPAPVSTPPGRAA